MNIKLSTKNAVLLLCFAVLLAGITVTVHGQSALDGFDPNANSQIFAIVVQPDGKLLVGGQFSTLTPNGGASVTRNNIVRLNPDGTVDTAFNSRPDSVVRAIALQADGKIVIGGDFNSISSNGGSPVNRRYIARLNSDGTLDAGFDPWTTASVLSLIVQPDGKILVGGNFDHFFPNGSSPGFTRNRMARLDTNGVPDSFDPNVSASSGFAQVLAMALQPDGKVIACGAFTSIGGQMRNRIARIDGATGLADSWDPNANAIVWKVALQPDGKILAGGDFRSAISTPTIGGQTRNRIARLDPTTGLADSWDPNANNSITAIAVQADGKIIVGGVFSTANSIGGQTRNHVARLDAVTGLADSFDPNLSSVGGINTFTVQPDGKILVGGSFSAFSPNGGASVTRSCIARFERDGRLDRTLDLGAVGNSILATAVQPDGKTLIGGSFTTVLGVTRNYIARLNVDGTLDTAFNPNANNLVRTIAVQADGKILVGGDFNGVNGIGGQTRNFIARLDATAGAADSWNPNANSLVRTIAVQADGKILVGGNFNGVSGIGGQTRNFIARLDATTGAADSWNPNANSLVRSIAVQADGKILASGNFNGASSIGGQTRNRIARLDATTGAADSFDPNANDVVFAVAVQADGQVLAGGQFSIIGGQTRNRIARLNATTGLADSWDPNANSDVDVIAVQADGRILAGGGFNGANSIGGQARNRIARLDAATGLADSWDPNASDFVYSIAVQTDGKILAGGQFATIGGQTRSLFARLTNDTAAFQNLAVTPTAITWTRAGSSPQLARVTFESSTDNANYTPVGNGTATGSHWTLTGLSLPTGQNIYIRARGYYRSAGSESIGESVRNVFLMPPPAPTNVVSRKLHNGTPFDISLPLTGSPGLECRSGGGANDYQIVYTFPSSVTFSNASVTTGAGSVSSNSGNGTTLITVNLTGVINLQTITLTLQGVSDGASIGDIGVQMGVLIGDTNGDGLVNSGDISQTKSKSGQGVDATNFREDLNVDGLINSADISLVKSKSGTGLTAEAFAERLER